MSNPEPYRSPRRYVALAEPLPLSGAEACRLRQEHSIALSQLALARRHCTCGALDNLVTK